MSALVSREAADFVIEDALVQRTVEHLSRFSSFVCADELLWATIFGNKRGKGAQFFFHQMVCKRFLDVAAPGSFDALAFRRKLISESLERLTFQSERAESPFVATLAEPFEPEDYVIGRYQVWSRGQRVCHGQRRFFFAYS